MTLRLAGDADTKRLAHLHATRITDGFLPSLGPAFLDRLYRRIVRSRESFAYVVTDDTDQHVAGFAAATTDIGKLYRSFALRDGLVAGAAAAPQLLRSWRRVLETARYPASGRWSAPTGSGEPSALQRSSGLLDLPDAEVLAVVVEESSAGRGIGEQVVDAATRRLAELGEDSVKVVAGSDNVAALRVYEKCGFTPRARIEVHEGVSSEVLVWNSSSR